MSFLYPRTVAIHRSANNSLNGAGQPQIGLTGYSGREQSTTSDDGEGEVVLFTNIPCSIQAVAIGKARGGIVPADVSEKPQWNILIQPGALAQYSVRDDDIAIDDEGYRYGVAQAYWTGLGYQLNCIRLKA